MPKRKKHSAKRQQTRLAVTVATSAVSLAFPALLTAAPHTPVVETPLAPSPEVQRLLLLAYTPENTVQDAVAKYFANDYNYCDAKVLAAFWGETTPYDAKVRLGDKMLRWGPADAQAHVPPAREQALQKGEQGEWICSWDEDGGYTLDDAGLLATYWGKGYGETKTKIRRLLVQGKNADVQAALQNALAHSNVPENTDQAALDKYFLNGYNYCDAKVLAAYWGESSPGAVKVRFGHKLLNGGPTVIQDNVPPARAQALQRGEQGEWICLYDTDGGYTYDDAALLATYWGESYPSGAKLKIERLLVQGKDVDIQAALQNAKANNSAPSTSVVPSRPERVASSGADVEVHNFTLVNDLDLQITVKWLDGQANEIQSYGGELTEGHPWISYGETFRVEGGAQTWQSHWFAVVSPSGFVCSFSPREGESVNLSQLSACNSGVG